jgi:hypothetical protein
LLQFTHRIGASRQAIKTVVRPGARSRSFAVGYQIVDDLKDFKSDISSGAGSTHNIISILDATSSLDESIRKARILGLEKSILPSCWLYLAIGQMSGTM